MYGNLFLPLCAVILFGGGSSASDGTLSICCVVSGTHALTLFLSVAVSRQADDCTSGFMSLDRMEAAVQGGRQSQDHVLGDVVPSLASISRQRILPYINFTCDGNILSWTFGAQWEGNSPRYTELQIWRSSGDGSYTKVGSTTIMLEEENSTQLYQYTLTSPLPFQAGDILGYFQGSQPTSQLRLLFEEVGSDYSEHFNIQDSPSSQFNTESNTGNFDGYQLLISVETSEFLSHGQIGLSLLSICFRLCRL